MPRRRATRGDLFAAIARAIGVVQVGIIALVFIGSVVNDGNYDRRARLDTVPGWVLVLDGLLCLAGVIHVVAAYRRGDLDEHTYDLRDPDRRG